MRVIDEDLNLSTTQRIVTYEYDPIARINSRVEIANFIEDLSDTMTGIKQETVYKDRIYNGVRVGPDVGFEAVRSDKKTRTAMNATEGFCIQKGNGEGSYHNVIYMDTEGNAWFTGRIEASEIYGGIINGAEIIANTTIDVGTDLRVGNMIYVGSGGNFNKGIVFSDKVKITYQDEAMQLSGDTITLASGGRYGGINLFSDGPIELSSGSRTLVDGISFDLIGDTLQVYNRSGFVGQVKLGDGSVG